MALFGDILLDIGMPNGNNKLKDYLFPRFGAGTPRLFQRTLRYILLDKLAGSFDTNVIVASRIL